MAADVGGHSGPILQDSVGKRWHKLVNEREYMSKLENCVKICQQLKISIKHQLRECPRCTTIKKSHTGRIWKAEVNVKLMINKHSTKGKVSSILMRSTSEQCWVHENN